MGQYKLLWDWAATEEHVYYATPTFHTDQEFSNRYHDILAHTAHFKLRQGFKNPYNRGFDDHQHFIYYSDADNHAKMYSDKPSQIPEVNLESMIGKLSNSKPKTIPFGTYVKETNQKLIELIRKNNNQVAQMENVRRRVDDLLASKSNIEEWDEYFLCKDRLKKYLNLDWITIGK